MATPALVVDLPGRAQHRAGRLRRRRRAAPALQGAQVHRAAAPPGRRQRSGVTCATAWEAEVLAATGFDDILVANQVADARSIGWLRQRAPRRAHHRLRRRPAPPRDARRDRRGSSTSSSRSTSGRTAAGCRRAATRCSQLARGAGSLRFRGLQGYEGHAVLLPDRDERAREVGRGRRDPRRPSGRGSRPAGIAVELVVRRRHRHLRPRGEAEGVLDEIQAGSYVLMDASYGRARPAVRAGALLPRDRHQPPGRRASSSTPA